MLGQGQDSALLRLSLGRELVNADNLDAAVGHFGAVIEQDPDCSAAGRELGKALNQAENVNAAARAWSDASE